jgi:hypothetical protein
LRECLADADADAYGNSNAYGISNSNANDYTNTWRQNYPHTATAWHAAPSAVTPKFNGIVFLRGLAMIASPRNAYLSREAYP